MDLFDDDPVTRYPRRHVRRVDDLPRPGGTPDGAHPARAATHDRRLIAADDPAGLVSLRSEWRRDAVVTTVAGEVDASTAGTVRAELLARLDERPATLVVDLRGVGFLGACGVSVLVGVERCARRRGVGLSVVAAHRRVLRPLLVTRAHHVLHLVPTLGDALA
ncbi:STAS domain-containing protein [Saccharothrix australiensis]|uniref:Anti-sigma factor antagonist n=1 Tax=Saccharothrix australiensis TaxID=2072 RepID=A0A495W3M9_9PSEU|nr:STAS domain-containing protein [Saccharothrix australiensis]RKT56262.1 anti-anti-sigma factor [Saccharothrix australiensis]